MRGHAAVVDLLLAAGAAVDAEADGNMTALRLAAAGGHEQCVRLLLKNGARPNARYVKLFVCASLP